MHDNKKLLTGRIVEFIWMAGRLIVIQFDTAVVKNQNKCAALFWYNCYSIWYLSLSLKIRKGKMEPGDTNAKLLISGTSP